METTQTTSQEGEDKQDVQPTPDEPVMQDQDSAQAADPEQQESREPEKQEATLSVDEISQVAGREFDSPDAARKWIREVNSFVGDQTRARDRKTLEKLASQANLTVDELHEVIDAQEISSPAPTQQAQQTTQQPMNPSNDPTTIRLTRLEVDNLVKEAPAAKASKDKILAEALATGKSASEIWEEKYRPVYEEGRKAGAKKLQSNIEGQPTKAASTASDSTDTKVDFSGVNPETGRRWTSKEMEAIVGYKEPTPGL